ncbi:ArpU family phage packaging/lysis transcriptional regulator [Virgibacillus sp. Bac330]|uniref:ArpU family phage packaging/lysis transcriptional regulator n=1 Tax=Virgibacillus sp. Bac330 TaxID=2419841 RepID=UPI000EF43C94|nr:ArpU family phage packaging/lysis transcriptional regulator [Virgibacillus sp. Bac330]
MQLAFNLYYEKLNKILTEEELDQLFKDEQQFFIDYVEKYWLNRYFRMKSMSKKTHVPSITATISDMPKSKTNEFVSKIENYALKSIEAAEWIDTLETEVNNLPRDYSKLIRLKYLQRRGDGQTYEDEVIYPKLNISRAKYYQMKKKALEELGRALFGHEF